MNSPLLELVKEHLPEGVTIDDVTILQSKTGKDMAVAAPKGENGLVQKMNLLGCETCIDPAEIQHLKGMMIFKGKRGIPARAVSEDDSLNPALEAIFICPDCGKPIMHKDFATIIGLGEDIDEWDTD